MADIMNPQSQEQQPFQDATRGYADSEATDDRDEETIRKDNELAERLSIIIEDANKRVIPIVNMIRSVRSTSSLIPLYPHTDSSRARTSRTSSTRRRTSATRTR